jgi:predicted kinase
VTRGTPVPGRRLSCSPAGSGHHGSVLTIVVSGPQATGKTTLAMALGTALAVPVFSRDPLMQALQAGRPWTARRRWVPAAGLRLQTALLARQLELGQSAILECIAPLAARQEWRRMSVAAGGRFLSVECTCTDAGAHRARFERRQGPGRRGRGWDDVAATIRHYQPDAEADFVADAMRPVADLVADVIAIAGDGTAPR